jgi:hypothetical protein
MPDSPSAAANTCGISFQGSSTSSGWPTPAATAAAAQQLRPALLLLLPLAHSPLVPNCQTALLQELLLLL